MLMSIIITLSYVLFNLVGKQIYLFEKENITEMQYNLFNTTIINDIEASHNFNVEENQLILEYYDDRIINYKIEENYVLRKNKVKTDTFKIGVVDVKHIKNNELNQTFQLNIKLLKDTIHANYFLNKNISNVINNISFNED
ncbi:hypothetical protein D7030_08330 [Flavobacteriaceae bacterium AU392]|nr:hypothetical protein D7030_08330 [Flavobacteriaceae bacterium AU392]